ncbi:MAG: PIG-L family deacetylase [Actinomycetes bacterium]
MSESPSTILAVHAHPDDETIFTGGSLAVYAARGVRTVVVTLTDGGLGYDPEGIPGAEPGHDELNTVLNRALELSSALRELGVSDHYALGYGDSGMAGWPQNDEPMTLCGEPFEEEVERLVEIIDQVKPDVVITYDANGFYGHPDHIRCHEVTVAALELCERQDIRFFEIAIPRSAIEGMISMAGCHEAELPAWVLDTPSYAAEDDRVTTLIDCSEFGAAKYRALCAHATQIDNSFFWELGEDLYAKIFSTEWYIARRGVESGQCASDLLEGLSA